MQSFKRIILRRCCLRHHRSLKQIQSSAKSEQSGAVRCLSTFSVQATHLSNVKIGTQYRSFDTSNTLSRAFNTDTDQKEQPDDPTASQNHQEIPVNEENSVYLEIQGLPWSAAEEDVKNFFDDVEMIEFQLLLDQYQRSIGRAIVKVKDQESVEKALKKDGNYFSNSGRYVNVRSLDEKKASGFKGETVAKIKGLPFHWERSDIMEFFEGIRIPEYGLIVPKPVQGYGVNCGVAYIQFESSEERDEALQLNGKFVNGRFIKVLKSDLVDAFDHVQRNRLIDRRFKNDFREKNIF